MIAQAALASAQRIAFALCEDAIWLDGKCTWPVWVPQRMSGVQVGQYLPAAGDFYQGTAGIAAFLMEMTRHLDIPALHRTAEGALLHAVAFAGSLNESNGSYYSGRVGIAYVLVRYAALTGLDWPLESARNILLPLVKHRSAPWCLDVIAGPAGAIPALLTMLDSWKEELLSDLVFRFRDEILDAAVKGPEGWSWGGSSTTVRDLTGFAHGASGFAFALLELYAQTGDEWCALAAQQAILYERHHYCRREQNWFDYRYVELDQLLRNHSIVEIGELIRQGKGPAPYRPACMTAWCHGAPGMAMVRFRAHELLSVEYYRTEGTIALETTAASFGVKDWNYSLCHGMMGNIEVALCVQPYGDFSGFLKQALSAAASGIARFGNSPRLWPGGAFNGQADPSLLLGTAGVGYQLLRISDPNTPSLLFPTPGGSVGLPRVSRSRSHLRLSSICEHFSNTIHAIGDGVLENSLRSRDDAHSDAFGAIVERGVTALRGIVRHARRRSGVPWLTHFAVESACYDLRFSVDDLTTDLFARARQQDLHGVDWSKVQVRLSPNVRLIPIAQQHRGTVSEDGGSGILVQRFRGAIHQRTLGQFATAVLGELREATSIDELVGRLSPASGISIDSLTTLVLQQIQQAYAGGIVSIVSGPLRHAMTRGNPHENPA